MTWQLWVQEAQHSYTRAKDTQICYSTTIDAEKQMKVHGGCGPDGNLNDQELGSESVPTEEPGQKEE